jgi:hypothetical protein
LGNTENRRICEKPKGLEEHERSEKFPSFTCVRKMGKCEELHKLRMKGSARIMLGRLVYTRLCRMESIPKTLRRLWQDLWKRIKWSSLCVPGNFLEK